MRKQIAQTMLYGGAVAALASAFADLATAQTWAEVLTPAHVFGALSTLVMAAGALYHPPPSAPPAP
jgi:hypothetical protein